MKYTLSVLVENHAGVLSKVSGLFSRRGFNIDSLAVGTTEDETMPVYFQKFPDYSQDVDLI